MRSGMRVVFFPYTESNPYQRCLREGLERLGVRVEAGTFGQRFSLRQLGWTGRGVDVVHLHWVQEMLTGGSFARTLVKGWLCMLHLVLLKACGTRVAWTVHNLMPHETRYPGLEKALRRGLAQVADVLFVHCDAARDQVARELRVRDARKIVNVRHGHYIGVYPDEVSREQARAELGIGNDEVVFLCLGAVRRYKGVLELIEGFAQVHARGGRSIRLVIAGKAYDPGLAREVRAAAEACTGVQVEEGFVPEDRLQYLLRAADAAVFPYQEILTSGAVVLAMSFGLACVAPRLGCMGEYLDEDGAVFFEDGSPVGLAQALESALGHVSRLGDMGRANRLASEEWGWDEMAQRTLGGYAISPETRDERRSGR